MKNIVLFFIIFIIFTILFFIYRIFFIADFFNEKSVNVYFGKTSQNTENYLCDKVYPVQRLVSSSEIEKNTLTNLLKGPTNEELANNFFTSINNGVILNKIEIINGIATADFSHQLKEGVAGSCRVIAIRTQITETLKQFSHINKVIISINGQTEAILEP